MPIKDYLKYYWLEKEYLEKEVYSDFHTKGYLTPEQFFAIIEWKNQKFGKTKISLTDKEIGELTDDIFNATSRKERLQILLENDKGHIRGIRLATASAILTILYPMEFTVYDIRVRKQLVKLSKNRKPPLWEEVEVWNKKEKKKEWVPLDITSNADAGVKKYLEDYLPAVRKVAEENGKLELRDCDRALWAKDWYEDLQNFIGSVDKSGRKKPRKDIQTKIYDKPT